MHSTYSCCMDQMPIFECDEWKLGMRKMFRSIFCLHWFVFVVLFACRQTCSYARFMAVNIIYVLRVKKNKSTSISYINNDSNNNGKARIFFTSLGWWFYVFFGRVGSPGTFHAFKSTPSAIFASHSLFSPFALHQFEDLNSENAFNVAILRRFICDVLSHAPSLSLSLSRSVLLIYFSIDFVAFFVACFLLRYPFQFPSFVFFSRLLTFQLLLCQACLVCTMHAPV